MGIPSVSILLHEVIKLMYHAKVRDPVFIRIGTCGGIGYEGGTVIISEEAVDEMMKPYMELVSDFIKFIQNKKRVKKIRNKFKTYNIVIFLFFFY